MYFALDQNNNRINIDDAIEQDIKACKCCFCKSEMNIRNGDVRRAHFAHKKGTMGTTVCDTFWSSRILTDWYFGWVDKFADEYREQIIENEKTGERHMVDLRIGNSVVFFVDGNLKPGEFEKQNRFFNNNGYRVRWIFRETDRFEGRYIRFTDGVRTEMEWKWARNTLNNYRPSDDVIVYLQLKDGDKSFIVQVSQVYGYNMSMFQVAPPHYEGIEEFILCLMEDGAPQRITSETIKELMEEAAQRALEERLAKFKAEIEDAQRRKHEVEEQKKTQVKRIELIDFYMHDSSFGLHPWEVRHPYPENCDNINTIIKEYDICRKCRYNLKDYKLPQDVYEYARYTACVCKFKDMNLLSTDQIIKVGRSIEGVIDEVEVLRNGEIITYTFDQGETLGKSLMELWKPEYKRMRVLNLKTGWKFQLTNPNEMRYRYRGRVYSEKICGPESNNYYSPRSGTAEIYDVDRPVWQLEWAAIGN